MSTRPERGQHPAAERMHNRPVTALDRDEAGRQRAVDRHAGSDDSQPKLLGLDWPVLDSPLGPVA